MWAMCWVIEGLAALLENQTYTNSNALSPILGYAFTMSLTFFQHLRLWLYSGVMYLLSPFTVVHLIMRGLRQRVYFQRWSERFAMYKSPQLAQCIWLHAVSVGEVNASSVLVKRLLERYPNLPLLLTTTTPTGSDRVKVLFGNTVHHVYLPYDTPGAVNHFLDYHQPKIALIMETEIWPNLFVEIGRRKIPLLIINARLSERSLRGYRVIASLLKIAFTSITQVLAQSELDLQRYQQLGISPAQGHVSGNLKFDIELASSFEAQAVEWRKTWGDRPVWIAASTHQEEEALVIAAHHRVRKTIPKALLCWAPRHPERFDAVQSMLQDQKNWRIKDRRSHQQPDADTDVFVINTLGELLGFYACADIAFVGGSLQPVGGHNLLEPAAMGVPSIIGPHTFNFLDISKLLVDAGAAIRIQNGEELADCVIEHLQSPAQTKQKGLAGKLRIEKERGALSKTLEVIDNALQGGI
jgi:3-deoxy-D-manno-octulosonic-acid transferase